MKLIFPILTFAIAIAISSDSFSQRRRAGAEDRISPGGVCLSEIRPNKTLLNLGDNVRIVRSIDNNHGCVEGGARNYFRVPIGMEGWVLEKSRKLGFRSSYAKFTAGGSGIVKHRLNYRDLFDKDVTPENASELKDDLQCKLNSKLLKSFPEVVSQKCRNSTGKNDFCWEFLLSGHTSSTPSLMNNIDIREKVGPGFWVSFRMYIEVAPMKNYLDYDMPTARDVARVDIVTIRSRFARSGLQNRPASDGYHEIGHYKSNIAPEDIDWPIASLVGSVIVNSEKLTCN
ncbi:MAG: hypothetical protein ACKVON_14645 [Beijerinckiaceae bacterium]